MSGDCDVMIALLVALGIVLIALIYRAAGASEDT